MKLWDYFWIELQEVLSHGGVILWAMLVLSVVMYGVLASTWLGLFKLRKQVPAVAGELENCNKLSDVIREVDIFELDQLAWVERRVPVIAVLIALAPLSGLLGTVSGMLATFAGLAGQTTAKPIDSISSGISEALVTTQAGLFMAIPAAFLFALLKSRIDQVRGVIEQFATQRVMSLKGGKV